MGSIQFVSKLDAAARAPLRAEQAADGAPVLMSRAPPSASQRRSARRSAGRSASRKAASKTARACKFGVRPAFNKRGAPNKTAGKCLPAPKHLRKPAPVFRRARRKGCKYGARPEYNKATDAKNKTAGKCLTRPKNYISP